MEDYPILALTFPEGADSTLLLVTDASLYAETAVNPMLDIRMPGYTSYRSVPFIPNKTNTYTARTLGIQPINTDEALTELPDGVYEIVYRMCPYEETYKKFYWLRDDSYRCLYLTVMSSWLDRGLESMPKTVSNYMTNADIYLSAAHISAGNGYVTTASKYYQRSLTYLSYLDKTY
jgi:hypothetical protein